MLAPISSLQACNSKVTLHLVYNKNFYNAKLFNLELYVINSFIILCTITSTSVSLNMGSIIPGIVLSLVNLLFIESASCEIFRYHFFFKNYSHWFHLVCCVKEEDKICLYNCIVWCNFVLWFLYLLL